MAENRSLRTRGSMSEERAKVAEAEESAKEEEIIKQHEALSERFKHLTSSEIIQRVVLIETALENIVAFEFCGDNHDRFLPFLTLIFRYWRINYLDTVKLVKSS